MPSTPNQQENDKIREILNVHYKIKNLEDFVKTIEQMKQSQLKHTESKDTLNTATNFKITNCSMKIRVNSTKKLLRNKISMKQAPDYKQTE